jgi:hypothetical protein
MCRTYCTTYSECRRTIPWALAVWTLYPLARIEIYCLIPTEQFLLDNDVPLELHAKLFNTKYFRLIQYDPLGFSYPVTAFPTFPCTYYVYMDPSFIPFGRDFLNTHIKAMVGMGEKKEPITYWNGKKLVLYMFYMTRKRPTVVRKGMERSIYFQFDDVLYPLADMDTLLMLRKSGYVTVEPVNSQFLQQATRGGDFSLPTVAHHDAVAASAEGYLRWANVAPLPKYPTAQSSSGSSSGGRVPAAKIPGLVIDALLIPEQQQQIRHSSSFVHGVNDSTHRVFFASDAPTSGKTGTTNPDNLIENMEPHIWLTSSTPTVDLDNVFSSWSQSQVETLVAHLDPIIQNSLMQKVVGFLPEDIVRVFKLLDATYYKQVISLIDAKNTNWGGEDCRNP